MAEIKGKRVLITGGSSGIGRTLALEFARKGAVLAIASRRLEDLEKASREITLAYPDTETPLAIPCDVTDGESVGGLIKGCIDRLGISFSAEPVGDAFSHRLSHLATVRKHKSRLGTCQ